MVVGGGTGGAGASTSHSLRMRGLPYQANEQDVEAFFEGFKVAKAVVVRKNGKPTGEGYAFFHSEQEASAALQRKNRESMGNRYIELFLDGKAGGGAGDGAPAAAGTEQRWFCGACGVQCSGEKAWTDHVGGVKHRRSTALERKWEAFKQRGRTGSVKA